MVTRPLPLFLIILALCLAGTQLGAQMKPQSKPPSKGPPVSQPKAPPKPESRLQGKKVFLILQGGAGFPVAKDSLTDIWRYGPNFSLDFLTSVSRRFSAGIGVDLTVLRWSYAGYYEKYPSGPPPLDRKVIWWDLYLLGRYVFIRDRALTPFVTLKIGATRPTPASFKTVDSVKVTYYSVPARTRLSIGASAGVDAAITDVLAFVAEVNAVLVNNDPVLGAAVSIRGGFRMTW